MPFALILIGAIVAVAGIRNTYGLTQPDGSPGLWGLVKNDFTAQGGYLVWVAAIVILGGIGYVERLRPLSIALLTLVLLVLVISNKGVFAQLQNFIQNPVAGAASETITGTVVNSDLTSNNPVSQGATALINSNLGAIP